MLVAASERGLLVRVGKEGEAEALKRAGASVMLMNGRTMHGYIRVEPSALAGRSVSAWVARARAYVETLPVRPSARRNAARAARTKGRGQAKRVSQLARRAKKS